MTDELMSDELESTRFVGEVVAEPLDARFDAESLLADAALQAAPEEVSQRVTRAAGDGGDLTQRLSFLEAGLTDSDEFDQLIALSRWLLSRPVHGAKVRTPLHSLIVQRCRELTGRSVEETDREFDRLAEQLRQLPVSNDTTKNKTVLGELIPPEYVVRRGHAEQTFKLTNPPVAGLDLADPIQDLRLLLGPGGDGGDDGPRPKGAASAGPTRTRRWAAASTASIPGEKVSSSADGHQPNHRRHQHPPGSTTSKSATTGGPRCSVSGMPADTPAPSKSPRQAQPRHRGPCRPLLHASVCPTSRRSETTTAST